MRSCSSPRSWCLVAFGGLAIVAALVATAWIQDDGYISLRCARNLVELGELTWNPGQRVQVYVHPAWILTLAGWHALLGNGYLAAFAAGVSLTLGTWVVLWRAATGTLAAGVFALLALLLSKAFVDFSTSALENPLSHLLIACFCCHCLHRAERPGALRTATFLASTIVLTRVDLLVLIAPVMLTMLPTAATARQGLRALAVGALPLVAWCAFALFYFGTLIPSPANAKVFAATFERPVLLAQGLRYLTVTATHDPLTLVVGAAGVVAGLAGPTWRHRALATGILGYVGYVVWIGGCFMAGRFFTVPMVAALVLLLAAPFWSRPRLALAALGAALAVGGSGGGGNLFAGRDLHNQQELQPGVYDCRAYYYQDTGLLAPRRSAPTVDRESPTPADHPALMVVQAVGVPGYHYGGATIVDPLGLCDPLLSRMPPLHPETFRPGHIRRHVPAGYLQTLALGENRIVDPALHRLWDHLDALIHAPLTSSRRWPAIWAQCSGELGRLLQEYLRTGYSRELRLPRQLAEFATLAGPGAPWHGAGVVIAPDSLVVELGERPPARLEVCIDANNQYQFAFLRGGVPVGVVEHPAAARSEALRALLLAVPTAAVPEQLAIVRGAGDGIMAVGRITALP